MIILFASHLSYTVLTTAHCAALCVASYGRPLVRCVQLWLYALHVLLLLLSIPNKRAAAIEVVQSEADFVQSLSRLLVMMLLRNCCRLLEAVVASRLPPSFACPAVSVNASSVAYSHAVAHPAHRADVFAVCLQTEDKWTNQSARPAPATGLLLPRHTSILLSSNQSCASLSFLHYPTLTPLCLSHLLSFTCISNAQPSGSAGRRRTGRCLLSVVR